MQPCSWLCLAGGVRGDGAGCGGEDPGWEGPCNACFCSLFFLGVGLGAEDRRLGALELGWTGFDGFLASRSADVGACLEPIREFCQWRPGSQPRPLRGGLLTQDT